MRDFLRQFLLYSRSERRAVVALAFLIVMVVIIPQVYHFYAVIAPQRYVDTSVYTTQWQADTSEVGEDSIGLFYFDPNTIRTDDWIRLGLTQKQAEVIEKYKSRGGKFRKPDDLRKIYTLSDGMKDKLVPYVRIKFNGNEIDKEKTESLYTIEINTADSAAFESLYGIGPYRASRIIRYRNQLGGFYSIDQVSEAHGLPDSVYQIIRPHLRIDPSRITQIDINSADFETLKKHPYIHTQIARALINYRNFNGRFDSVGEIRKVKPVTQIEYNKVYPYLKVGE